MLFELVGYYQRHENRWVEPWTSKTIGCWFQGARASSPRAVVLLQRR